MIKKVFNIVLIMISFQALALLLAPTTFHGIAIFVCEGLIASLLFVVITRLIRFNGSLTVKILAPEILLILLLMKDFYRLWVASSRVSVLAKSLHMSTNDFLWIVGGILGVLSLKAIDTMIQSAMDLFHRIPMKASVAEIIKSNTFFFLVLFLENLQMDYSVLSSLSSFFRHKISIIIINCLLVMLLNLAILLIVQSRKAAIFITTVFFTVWSVVNYYVIEFHGSPLFPITFYTSGKTGIEVAGSYRYAPNYTVACLMAMFLVNTLFIFGCIKKEGKTFSLKQLFARFLCMVVVFLTVVAIFMGKGGFLPAEGSRDAWNRTIANYGFMVSSVWDVKNHDQWLIRPAFYSTEKVELYNVSENQDVIRSDSYPDIILILNETFCDLNAYTDLRTDRDFLSDFYSVEGAFYGYAITPLIGGGTNDSEFELLTSKSVGLLSTGAPFTYFTRTLEGRSIVEYLHTLDYTTTGMHCGAKTNYFRDTAYPAIGFEHIFLGADDFKYYRKNGNRSWYDSDNYRDLIDHYEENRDDGPQFFFLLTLQNHGGFEQNDDSLDTVHVKDEYGDVTDDVNEFLSSIELSGKAFKELTEYYVREDRPVIICMVGDHAPPFVRHFEMDDDCPIQNPEIGMRIVPYVMWSNYGVDFSFASDYAAMTDLVPILLKSAGIPMSSFYNEIVELHEELPVRTSDGLYVDDEGQIGSIEESRYNESVHNYYMMEYNSLLTTDEYREELFLPKT